MILNADSKSEHFYLLHYKQGFKILLDGKEIKQVVFVDTDNDMAVVNKTNKEGSVYIEPGTEEIAQETIFGKVEIVGEKR